MTFFDLNAYSLTAGSSSGAVKRRGGERPSPAHIPPPDMRALIKHNPKMEPLRGDVDQMATESQLAALQEQLVAVMLENQHLNDELKDLRETGLMEQLRQQLEREKEKSRILMERLQEREIREKDYLSGERETARERERERHLREKSLPPGDKSPSLPQRIRKRINQMHKSQSFDVDDGGAPGPPPAPPPTTEKSRLSGEDKASQKAPPLPTTGRGYDPPAYLNVKYGEDAASHKSGSTFDVVESPSRGRFVWKRRGLEKSKSLDQSEFLASLNGAGTGGGGGGGGGSTTASSEWLDGDQPRESDSDDPDREKGILAGDVGGAGSDSEPGSCPGSVLAVPVVSPKDPWWRRLEVRIVSFVSELVKDFSEVAEEELPDGDPEGDPLTVKKLKENILRFGCVMRPLTELSFIVRSLLHWESPSATLLALVVYLYCVFFGWVLTLFLLLAIVRLSVNYMKKKGWTQTMFRRLRREGAEQTENPASEAGLGDKFALVLQVARRVQNQLGAVSNAAEKFKNLLLWEHEATSRLYAFLWLVLLASILLPSHQLFTLTGVYLGLKFFVLDYIFYRYPRIRHKYDTTSRLWDTLPTDADLERRGDKSRHENGNSSPDLTSFLELFNLPATESPLPGWQSGRRCTLVNRDRSITSAFKNGRLYLTNRLAKQEKQSNSSTNKASASSNKLTTSSTSKGQPGNKSPLHPSSSSSENTKKTSSLSGSNSPASSSFSFLNKGSKASKAKEQKESNREDEELDMLASIFVAESSEPVTPSKLSKICEKPKDSPKPMRLRDQSISELRPVAEAEIKPEEARPLLLTRRRKLLLRSVSELAEIPADIPKEEDAYHSSPDMKRHVHDSPIKDSDSKAKKTSKFKMKTSSFESKNKTSVMDKLNDRVFFAV